MPRALVIGGRGQSGRAITQRLIAGGWEVTATASSSVESLPADVTPLALERDAVEDFAAAIPGEFDVVIDDVAFTPAHGEQLISLGDRVGSVVLLSTLSVYSDAAGRSLDLSDETGFPEWPNPIPPDWATLTSGTGYSADKAALERLLRERAPWPVTVIRPGAIHGRYSRHLREWYFIQRALDGRRQVILPHGGALVFQPTATVNMAELVALAAARPGDRTLNCGDLNPPTPAEISAVVDELMGVRTERVLVDGPEPAPTVGNHPWNVPRQVVADMTSAATELGYEQPVDYATALAGTLAWAVDAVGDRDWREVFTTLAKYPTDMFDYAAEDAWLAGSV